MNNRCAYAVIGVVLLVPAATVFILVLSLKGEDGAHHDPISKFSANVSHDIQHLSTDVANTLCFMQCNPTVSAFSKTLVCPMIVEGTVFTYVLYGLLAVFMLFYFWKFKHCATREVEKKPGNGKYAVALFDVALGLFMMVNSYIGGSYIAKSLAPLKLIAITISFQKKVVYDPGGMPTAFDMPACFLEVIFLMGANTDWWLTLFVEQPLHW